MLERILEVPNVELGPSAYHSLKSLPFGEWKFREIKYSNHVVATRVRPTKACRWHC